MEVVGEFVVRVFDSKLDAYKSSALAKREDVQTNVRCGICFRVLQASVSCLSLTVCWL